MWSLFLTISNPLGTPASSAPPKKKPSNSCSLTLILRNSSVKDSYFSAASATGHKNSSNVILPDPETLILDNNGKI